MASDSSSMIDSLPIEVKEVQVRFFTRTYEEEVPNTPFSVPVSLARFGLSEVINHLLDHGDEKHVAFDFLINGEFLRTTLSKYLEKHNLSTESTLNIEYQEARPLPKLIQSVPHDDWVSSILVTPAAPERHLISASYDGKLRLLSDDGANVISTFSAHRVAIKSSILLRDPEAPPTAPGSSCIVISSSKDQSIRSTRVKFETNEEDQSLSGATFERLSVFRGHVAAVDCLAANPDRTRFCSGGWDNAICIFNFALPGSESEEEESAQGKKKLRKTAAASSQSTQHEVTPLFNLEGHTQAVTGLSWTSLGGGAGHIHSCSMDNSVRSWDVETTVCPVNMSCSSAALCIAVHPEAHIMATGHADNAVRLWDPRATGGAQVKRTLISHTGWVSALSWLVRPIADGTAPEYVFASSSYDGTMKLWDIRSNLPLHTITGQHSEKILCMGYAGGSSEILYSGSADCSVKAHALGRSASTIVADE